MRSVCFHYQSSFEGPHPGRFIAISLFVETYSFFERGTRAPRAVLFKGVHRRMPVGRSNDRLNRGGRSLS